ncbi:bifunctional (p)ppGpp synthetase/guanosine-3',5'-bis(diphosphate) 3'-pyrophosphohydrolase [Puteibacter caeruleilacunae]|nr:bifunctional (p)ppGpp synthetase/guanosine-3',5'-bis(diphosphate) 3'-pyrophosphohydrolase [Puteibacter caeruleilacunae]
MTQEIFQRAIRFAGEKHYQQDMPGGKANYLVHVSNVAMEVMLAFQHTNSFDLNFAVQVALLHDTLEDTNTSREELEVEFGQEVANAVEALSKNDTIESKKERMLDSLQRILPLSKEVGIVKLADRITNMQKPPAHWNQEKIYYYKEEAKVIAKHLADKNTYLHERLVKKIKDYENNFQK